jgi:hypothetical protein
MRRPSMVYIRVFIVTAYLNPSVEEFQKPGQSGPISHGGRGDSLHRLIRTYSATYADAYLIGTLTYNSRRKTAGAWNWRTESQYRD